MIHEENKKQQPEEHDFMEMIIGSDKKNPQQEQQTVTHRDDFTADEKSVETEDTKSTASNTKRTNSKPKKLTKEDYCGQFFKIPNTTASKGKSVYVRQEHHETFNRLTNIMGIDKLTIYAYLDNIIEYHFQEFGELIKEIYNEKHKPLF
ncbi:conjugal transfer protein TraB [Elizabethkingia miricola]|nr:conjugal transfer protein TraB [Elizabethkingia miricola]